MFLPKFSLFLTVTPQVQYLAVRRPKIAKIFVLRKIKILRNRCIFFCWNFIDTQYACSLSTWTWILTIPGLTKHFARGLQYGSWQSVNISSFQIYAKFNSWSNKTKSKAIASDAMILQKFSWKNGEVKSLKNPWIFFVFLSKCTFP